MRVKAYFTVRNPRRTWTGSPPDAATGDNRPHDLEVAELAPMSSVPDPDALAAVLFGHGAMLYLENATRKDQLSDGQVVALELELELAPLDAPIAAPTAERPAARGRSDARGSTASASGR